MKLNSSLSAVLTAAFLASSLTSASAQTLTVTGTAGALGATIAGNYVYSYVVTPSGPNFNVNLVTFNFSDPNVFFLSASSGNTPGPLGLTAVYPGTGVFTFDTGTLVSGNSETFAFYSSDASGSGPASTVGATGVAFNGSGVAAVNGITPAPAAAPEPSTLFSLALLGGCLGLGIIARKRKMVV